MLFELGAVQTQTVHGSLCETEQRTNDPLALQTLPAVQSEACMRVCARVHVSMHLCPSIAAVRYKYGATPYVNALCLTFTGM